MSARNTNTKTATAQAAEQVAPAANEHEAINMADVREWAAQLGLEIPTGRQMLVGLGVSMLVGFVGGYIAAKFAIAVFLGALLLTSSAFIAWMMAIIVYILGSIAAVYAGSKVATYVTSGQAAAHIEQGVGFVRGFFRRSPATESVAA